VQWLDEVVFSAVDSLDETTNLSIVVGEKDHHYRHHVLPLQEYAQSRNKNVRLTVLPGLPHSEIGGVYRRFLSQGVGRLLASNGNEERLADDYADLNPGDGSLTVSVLPQEKCDIAFRLYRDSELIAKLPYGSSTTATWTDLKPARYRVRVFHRNTSNGDVSAFTTPWAQVR